jgi:tetratricopeptide (TPR) repeat protein
LYLTTKVSQEYGEVVGQYFARVAEKDYGAAERVLLDALANPSFSDSSLQFTIHATLAGLYSWHMKDQAAAEKHYLAALESDGDSRNAIFLDGKSGLLFELANVLDETGRYDEAVKYFQESLNISKGANPVREMQTFMNMGIAYVHLKDFDRGEYYLEEARKRIDAQEPVDLHAKSLAYNNMAWMYRRSARYDKALQFAQDGAAIAEIMNDKQLKATLYDTLAQILFAQARYEEALKYSEKSLMTLPESEYMTAVNYRTHGSILLSLNRRVDGCKSFVQALDFYARAGNEKERLALLQESRAQGC